MLRIAGPLPLPQCTLIHATPPFGTAPPPHRPRAMRQQPQLSPTIKATAVSPTRQGGGLMRVGSTCCMCGGRTGSTRLGARCGWGVGLAAEAAQMI